MKKLLLLLMIACISLPAYAQQAGTVVSTEELQCRDPFIYLHPSTGIYYLHVNGGGRLKCYTSEDLKTWEFIGDSFVPASDFWGKRDFWAPDLYEYEGKYYIFATFSAPGKKRGTSILVSDSPGGPFRPLVNGPVTPPDQTCLDGSLYIDTEGDPWLIYSHEWIETIDGEVCAVRLSEDLRTMVGEPVLLFRASSAPWVIDVTFDNVTGKVTDAPVLFRLPNGKLVMLWSSFAETDGDQYAIGQAYSEGGITGPWVQCETPIKIGGGHSMLFRDKNGRLMLSCHSPNTSPSFLTLQKVRIHGETIRLAD